MTDPQLDLVNIKQKLIEQIKTQYDEEKAKEFISKINDMTNEQFIEFLKQQGLIQGNGEMPKQQCIFCSIVYGDIPSTKIDENEEAIAILELNPITLGHSLIIPKEHIESEDKITDKVKELAKVTSEKINRTFKPKNIEIFPGHVMGHQLINILPIYNNETMESSRTQQTPEGLEELKKQIENSKPEQIEEPKKQETIAQKNPDEEIITEKDMILPKRIP